MEKSKNQVKIKAEFSMESKASINLKAQVTRLCSILITNYEI